MSKKKKKIQETTDKKEHIPGWRDDARSLGWPNGEIETLDSILAIAKNEERVVHITKSVIYLLSIRNFCFDGIDRNGVSFADNVQTSGIWKWYYRPPPVTKIEARSSGFQQVWCPSHGIECEPTTHGCGLLGFFSIEVCGCGKWHERDCEVGRRLAQERVELETKAREKRETVAKPTETPAWVAPVTKKRRVTKATGWLLPGQTAMDLTGKTAVELTGKPVMDMTGKTEVPDPVKSE